MSYIEHQREYQRRYYLPVQIERARDKLMRLEAEAQSYGMTELLQGQAVLSRAWERETEIARLQGEIKQLQTELAHVKAQIPTDMDEISNRVSAFYAKGGSMVEVYD